MSTRAQAMINFCMIQLQIIKDREKHLRNELLNCKIQEEFLTDTLKKISEPTDEDKE